MDVESESGAAAPSLVSTGELFMKRVRGEHGSDHERVSSRYTGGGGRTGGRLLRSVTVLVPSLPGRPNALIPTRGCFWVRDPDGRHCGDEFWTHETQGISCNRTLSL